MSRFARIALQCTAVVALATGLAACGSKTSSPSSSGSGSTATTSGGSSGGSSATMTVVIKNYKFMPSTFTVKTGTTINVHNEDSVTHTFTADNKSFDSGDIPAGGTKTVTPSKAGSIGFMCTIHPFMTGTVTVSG